MGLGSAEMAEVGYCTAAVRGRAGLHCFSATGSRAGQVKKGERRSQSRAARAFNAPAQLRGEKAKVSRIIAEMLNGSMINAAVKVPVRSRTNPAVRTCR